MHTDRHYRPLVSLYASSLCWCVTNIINVIFQNDIRELKFNTTGQCQSPLLPTDNTQAFYEGVEGCGVQCQNPLLTSDEHRQIHQLVAWAGTICLLFNLFTVVSKPFDGLNYDCRCSYCKLILLSAFILMKLLILMLFSDNFVLVHSHSL